MNRIRTLTAAVLAAAALHVPPQALAQPTEGGLYIAGASGFTFKAAADQALANNPAGQRFFMLVVPPQTRALRTDAASNLAALRDRVIAAGGVIFVCQRDIDKGRVDPGSLVSGVVAVRGWGPNGANDLPMGGRYFPGEDSSVLPASNNSLRQLRSTCAY